MKTEYEARIVGKWRKAIGECSIVTEGNYRLGWLMRILDDGRKFWHRPWAWRLIKQKL